MERDGSPGYYHGDCGAVVVGVQFGRVGDGFVYCLVGGLGWLWLWAIVMNMVMGDGIVRVV